jgi:hypothetical protein
MSVKYKIKCEPNEKFDIYKHHVFPFVSYWYKRLTSLMINGMTRYKILTNSIRQKWNDYAKYTHSIIHSIKGNRNLCTCPSINVV